MARVDPNTLFRQAEAAYATQNWTVARSSLRQLAVIAPLEAAVHHLSALVEKGSGNRSAALLAFEKAAKLAPNDPQIANNQANLLADTGHFEDALAAFGRALRAKPGFVDAALNRAIVLGKLEQDDEARTAFSKLEQAASKSARYWSTWGAFEYRTGNLRSAAEKFERALEISPKLPTALRARARIALERGDGRTINFVSSARAALPEDRELNLIEAQWREAMGLPDAEAPIIAALQVDPTWLEGLAVLARMRWEAGNADGFIASHVDALAKAPNSALLWRSFASTLAAAELHEAAIDVARRGRAACEDDPALALIEVVQLGQLGNTAAAEALLAIVPDDFPDKLDVKAEHLIRIGAFDRAETVLETLRQRPGDQISAWAKTDLIWRATADPRAEWLHEQPGLVSTMTLDIAPNRIADIANRLRELHTTQAHPIGQSLRNGTQTRGRLFERLEPECVELRDAVMACIRAFWSALPAHDATHPLLRHRDAQPFLAGSWSVRLTGGGFHVSHIHPRGVISSACYFVVPDEAGSDSKAGWIELGAPPPSYQLTLEPLHSIQPLPGKLVLFPSTLMHGTRPFARGERVTAAFDVLCSQRDVPNHG